uniref:Uncharacterized protein LOC104266112 n=1 Tax=Phallusia mammillata TaxID=59560 RepID=A0A6F9DJN9_9ASCI|nr:uncharacterized protein LOC104266112 [Phallusia mammillata]
MMENQPNDIEWIAQRCRYLSAMIRTSTIPKDSKLLTLQEKVCQKLVSINPCSSESLYLLGTSQLLIFDNDNGLGVANQSPLLDARQSFQASIDLEGKPASGDVPPGIAGQTWWIKKMDSAKAKQTASTSDKNQPAARGRGAPAAPSRGRGRGAPAPAKAAPPTRGRGAVRPPARGRGAPPRGAKATPADPKCSKEAEKPPQETPATPVSKPSKPAPLNRVTYHARLGMARALSRTDDKKDEARKRYEEVMKMAPEVHDSYIELADLLVKSDPLAAVDIYCKFPSSEENTDSFDDAYLSGEIVSILMKHEKLDDHRLVDHMVKWGKVMGIGVLEKYMEILDAKFKTDMLKKIYCGVHGKDVDDPDLVAFFKFKCWI